MAWSPAVTVKEGRADWPQVTGRSSSLRHRVLRVQPACTCSAAPLEPGWQPTLRALRERALGHGAVGGWLCFTRMPSPPHCFLERASHPRNFTEMFVLFL